MNGANEMDGCKLLRGIWNMCTSNGKFHMNADIILVFS